MKPRAEVALASIIATAFILLASGAGRAQDTAQSLYEAARREGKVVVWTALDVSLHKKVAAKFNAKYPDIAVEAFKIFPGPAIERLITEAKGGKINVDIIDPNIAFLPLLFDRGFAEPYPYDKVFGIDPQRLLFDRRDDRHWALRHPDRLQHRGGGRRRDQILSTIFWTRNTAASCCSRRMPTGLPFWR